MSDGDIGLFLLVGLSVASAWFFHARVPSFIGATLAAALAANVLFGYIAFLQLGYLDPFFLLAASNGCVYSVLIAIPVGFVVRYFGGNPPPKVETPRKKRRYLP